MMIVKVYVQTRMAQILTALHLNLKTSMTIEQMRDVLKFSMS